MLKVIGGVVLVAGLLLGAGLFFDVLENPKADISLTPQTKESIKGAVNDVLETTQDASNDGLDSLQKKVNGKK